MNNLTKDKKDLEQLLKACDNMIVASAEALHALKKLKESNNDK